MKDFYRIVTCLYITLFAVAHSPAQGNDELFRVVKSSNGQSFLLNSKGSGQTVYTDIYFRTGPIYEFDSLSGISIVLAKVIDAHIGAELRAGDRPVKYHSSVEPEQVAFHFESGLADLDYVLHLANDRIVQAKLDDEGLDEAKTEIRTELDSLKGLKHYLRDSRIMHHVWGNDYKKLNPYGDLQTYTSIKLADLAAFHTRYYLPFNNSVSILGSFSEDEVLAKLEDVFKDFKSKEFNPEFIDKVIDFKPVINTVQLLFTNADRDQATITYQNPGARQDRGATYAAFVLTEMINDKDGRIQRALRDSGLSDIKAYYLCNNFYGTMVLSAEPSGNKYVDAFRQLSGLIADICRRDYFKEEDIENARKNIAAEYNDMKTGDMKNYMSLVARYRFSNDENYFTSFTDSISAVTVDRMRYYAAQYYTDHSGVRSLSIIRDSIKNVAPDQQYFPLDESIKDVRFAYDLNKSDIETDEARRDLSRVVQWLRINPDMHVQINGFADEGEFVKAYDDTILHFIDSTPTFHKAMPDVTRKGYLRLEFMRAMKIAKALYEAGISEDRISGTSMVFTSETKEGAAANRKCTLSFEKIKPRVSLYEYHFGRKKEESDTGQK